MRLAEFLATNVEPVLAEWESFARANWPGAATDPETLRDHAHAILTTVAADMGSAQTLRQQSDKSKGIRSGSDTGFDISRASAFHGADRLQSGFDIVLLIAEYRALRASVLRLWRESVPAPDQNDIDDITRFNESIDHSLAEAVLRYTRDIDRSREMFLAILGHDLRNPLHTITLIAKVISMQGRVDAETLTMIGQISSSAKAMVSIIADLLDFASTRLGAGMPVVVAPVNLKWLCTEVVKESRAGHPDRAIVLDLQPDADTIVGQWDGSRLRQVISNLIGNAVQHGDVDRPITLTLTALDGDAVLRVHNFGRPISPDKQLTIFNPLVRDVQPDAARPARHGSIGLGLYIAREIITAHGGTLAVESNADAGTTFSVCLPRCGPTARA